MDPTKVVNSWITSLIRLAIVGVGGFFLKKGIADQSLMESTTAVLVAGGIAAFWSLYEKYHIRKTVLTALSVPSSTTPTQLQEIVKSTP